MTQFICECNLEFELDEDKHYQFLNGEQLLFTGCTCGRGKMGLIQIVEGD